MKKSKIQQSDLQSFLEVPFSYYFIYDLQKSTFDFVEDKISNVLGYVAEEINIDLFLARIHKSDLQDLMKHEISINRFLKNISIDHYFDFIFRYDFRIETKSGIEKRILQEVKFHTIDEDGIIHKVYIKHTDISGLQFVKSNLAIIGINGQDSIYNVDAENSEFTDFTLTKREIEIVKLLAKNYSSVQISEKLFISIHTVNTHRKNILSKSKCNNFLELILLLKQKGWTHFQ